MSLELCSSSQRLVTVRKFVPRDFQSIWVYIKELKDKKIFTNKQRKFLSHISIYTHNLNVYKVILNADMRKKNGKRVGVDYSMLIYEKGKDTLLKYKDGLIKEEKIFKVRGETLTFPLLKSELKGSEKGSKIFIYNIKKDDVSVYEGETPTGLEERSSESTL